MDFCTTNMFEPHADWRKMSMPLVGAFLIVFSPFSLTKNQNYYFDAASILQSEYEGNLYQPPPKISKGFYCFPCPSKFTAVSLKTNENLEVLELVFVKEKRT